MITTPDLIESLVANAAPVRRLRPPVARAVGWLLFAALMLALLAVSHDVRPDLALRLRQPEFVIGVAASLATGVLAAIASFLLSIPDRSRAWLLLPLPGLFVWVSTLGYGCLINWVSLQPGSVPFGEEAGCFALLVLTGVPLSLAMLIMLRHAALLAPTRVAISGGLAVAAVTATALSIFHDHDASAIILIWNFGTAVLLVALGGAFGSRMFSWVAQR
ncbi:MAG TPA: NrsF family protein [Burkholderiales bacterium]|nr:NrsF family protein [Burkholderiales bacterium]